MTRLRQRTLEELQRRNYSQHTTRSYIHAVKQFAEYFGRSPQELGAEEIRRYQLYLLNEKKYSAGTVKVRMPALRFLYKKVLKRRDLSFDDLVYPKKPKKLPVVLSPEEVARLIEAATNPMHRTMLIRGPGKYCGVVVFDRWDTCFLLSGSYITYISENAKNELRPYAGKAMQLDASSVFQPENPGDALIREYTMVGPAPDTQRWATLDGLKLIARSDFGPDGKPTFMIEVHNSSGDPIKVDSHEVGPALLGRVSKSPFLASDGNSMAVITRGDLVTPSSWGSTVDGVPHPYTYAIDPKTRPAERFQLNPGQSMKARITFEVSPGEYQFMFGYGGGVHEEKSLASNAISFDLSDGGVAHLTE